MSIPGMRVNMQRRHDHSSYAVAITGGSGCLGQHLVKLLQTKADLVSEIRILDKLPYENKLGHEETKPVTSVRGDITNTDDLRRTFRGVKTVFHLCSLVTVSNFTNREKMEKINVMGTKQVIEACILEGVERLIYCSTIYVVVGHNDIVDGTEDSTTVPRKLVDAEYGGTKGKAESMVLKANGRKLAQGGVLKTASLRLTAFYGEQDRNYIPRMLKYAKQAGGVLWRVGNGKSRFQHSYAGNVAWAFVCADQALRRSAKAAGETYFITDDTPAQNLYQLIDPFLKARGFRLAYFSMPYWFAYLIMLLVEIILWIISPLKMIETGMSASSFTIAVKTFTFSSEKARSLLKYTPLFSSKEAIEWACSYYNRIQI